MIPEAQNTKTLRVQPLCSFCILLRFDSMLSAVGFNDQRFFVADKIDDKATDLFLPTKLQAFQLLGTEVAPKQALGVG